MLLRVRDEVGRRGEDEAPRWSAGSSVRWFAGTSLGKPISHPEALAARELGPRHSTLSLRLHLEESHRASASPTHEGPVFDAKDRSG